MSYSVSKEEKGRGEEKGDKQKEDNVRQLCTRACVRVLKSLCMNMPKLSCSVGWSVWNSCLLWDYSHHSWLNRLSC